MTFFLGDCHHGGTINNGEVDGLTEGKLDESALSERLGYPDPGDDLVIVKDGRFGYGYLEEVLRLDGAPGCLYRGIEGNERRCRIAGMDRVTALLYAAAEDGVIPVISVDGIAPSAAFSEAGEAVVLDYGSTSI